MENLFNDNGIIAMILHNRKQVKTVISTLGCVQPERENNVRKTKAVIQTLAEIRRSSNLKQKISHAPMHFIVTRYVIIRSRLEVAMLELTELSVKFEITVNTSSHSPGLHQISL